MPVWQPASPLTPAANLPGYGPCGPWTTADKLCCSDVIQTTPGGPCNTPEVVTNDPYTVDEYLAMASEILFAATGSVWPGECQQKLWWNTVEPTCASKTLCGCAELPFIQLGETYPIGGIVSVRESNSAGVMVVVPASQYRIDDYGRLVRLTGGGWQACTTEVEVVFGRKPPTVCERAAAELACELMKLCRANAQTCLPRGATSMSMNGTTINVASIKEALADGKIPLPFVQMCQSIHMNAVRAVSVWSPDLDEFHATTWP